jgi:hypothetical protein
MDANAPFSPLEGQPDGRQTIPLPPMLSRIAARILPHGDLSNGEEHHGRERKEFY